MKLKNDVKHAMEQLHINMLRKHQSKPIDIILDGQDTLVIALTGSGKSAIFQVAALVMHQKQHTWTLVIEPTLSLMEDQAQALNSKGIPAGQISCDHPIPSSKSDERDVTARSPGACCYMPRKTGS